ncbi:Uu.00g137680.m01.CDS01 [Anthostomella pinea]|uniref:Uu.00g137680.m01.CDS01 n=1 Tax=Anthostomella pinea TaxID=933095 RepID=A0AAI8VQR7_9PEZI|nr:Uu.00g137680.m01.CDS01 [Anthostomella pinea]
MSSEEDSDFYGDDDVLMDLKAKVRKFDVDEWWQDHKTIETPLKLQARKQADEGKTRLHNPYAGEPYAWQLTESVDDFLKRVPPATTEDPIDSLWIWICNPYIERKAKRKANNQRIRGGEDEAPEEEGADPAGLVEAGEERLHLARQFIDECKASGQTKIFITRECRKAGLDASRDILDVAKELRVTCGKWMLFCDVIQVNDVWGIIAHATANNELGIAAKVAPKSTKDTRTERLICVYTADFTDTKDVKRVAERLKLLGLVRAKPLYYKPGQSVRELVSAVFKETLTWSDCYTYLGIASGNPWEIKASIYDTKSMLGR